MRTFEIAKGIIIHKGTKAPEGKHRQTLSAQLISNFNKGPFSSETVTEMLRVSQQYFIDEFESIVQKEKSLTFYRTIFVMNEMAANLRMSPLRHSLPEGLDKTYLAGYGRTLKMILEAGCTVEMEHREIHDLNFIRRFNALFDELLYLGEMIGCFSECLAEQTMVEDISDICFDEKDLFHVFRRHHYEAVIEAILPELDASMQEYVVDGCADKDYKEVIQESFGFDPRKLLEILVILEQKLKLEMPYCMPVEQKSFIKDVSAHAQVDTVVMERFLNGMCLGKENRMPLSELVKSPNSFNRMLYRPILEWTVNGRVFYVFGFSSMIEAEIHVLQNAIPWGKFPSEWEGFKLFTKYVSRKEDAHDKWLDNAVEKKLIERRLFFDRNVENIQTKSKSYDLKIPECGEIDFLVIWPEKKRLLIIECKHLVGRHDMVNWRRDYLNFTESPNGFNARITRKIKWINEHRSQIEEHFQRKYKKNRLSLDSYQLEGVFVINTPTFYMYNAPYRIYTVQQLGQILEGGSVDKVINFTKQTDRGLELYHINYPYFQKPKLAVFDMEEDDGPVDQFGDLIKK